MKKLVLFLSIIFLSVTAYSQVGKVAQPYNGSKEIGIQKDIRLAPIFVDDFESYANGDLDIGAWRLFDGDGQTIGGIQGFEFPHQTEAIAWTVVDWSPSTTIPAHSGVKTVATMYNYPSAAQNDDWLISPPITLQAGLQNAVLSFWTYILTDQYGPENLSVYISTDTSASTSSDFTTLLQSYVISTATTWEERVIPLDTYINNTVRIALKYHSTDVFTVLVDDFSVSGVAGPGEATNPNPVSGATNIAISLPQVTWSNPAGTVTNQFWFGTNPASLTMMQSGSLATSAPITSGSLVYNTTYYWRIDEIDASGTTFGTIWNFKTQQDPNLVSVELFNEDFENGTADWTITNDGGTCVWEVLSSPFPNDYTLPTTSTGAILSADADECGSGSTTLTTAMITQSFDMSQYTELVSIEFDNDWYHIDAQDEAHVEVSVDGGSTWTGVWDKVGASVRESHEVIDITSLASGHPDVKIRLRSVQPGYDWWWVVDNFVINGEYITPVELTSFTANSHNNNVELNWSTATETNNQGFEVQRKSTGDFEKIGFVQGSGTTTQSNSYSFIDNKLTGENYTYRLKQIDFDGTFAYSPEVEINIAGPATFSLDQNYPNPFNPSTKINFSIAVDSKVTLKVFDVIGQEVATVLNTNLTAGHQEATFNASNLNSGVYFYRLEAKGIDGTSFVNTKKMILTK